MSIRVYVRDLQSKREYRGVLQSGIIIGEPVYIQITTFPPFMLRIHNVRGWLRSLDSKSAYLMDGDNRRYLFRLEE